MTPADFERTVARLERSSARHPTLYQLKVAALALVGFSMLAALVAGALGGLLLLAGGVVATMWLGWAAVFAVVKLGKLAILLAIPLWLLLKSAVSALLTRLPRPEGLALTRAQAPQLFAAMDEMRRRMKGPRFHEVLLTEDVNAAVLQRPAFGLVGWPRNHLLIGLPLLESLSPDEARAVVAHEYGHLAGSHSRFGAFIYRLRHTWGAIEQASEGWSGWGGRLLRRAVAWYAPHFNAYTFVLARANEYAADAASARLVGAPVAAAALKRVNLSAAQFERFVQATFERASEQPEPPADLSQRWAGEAGRAPADDALRWLQEALERQPHVADTHPVLRDRLGALAGGTAGEQALEVPPPLQGPTAAQAWLGDGLPALREALQRRWAERVGGSWLVRHEAIRQRRERLAELRAIEAPSVDERFERLRLEAAFEPGTEPGAAISALAAFNAEHADHPGALFLQGMWLLHQGDAAGLDALDRASALDADAIKPACERAHAFCQARGDTARAEGYERRWHARNEFERERSAQLQALAPGADLRAPALPPEADETMRALLRQHGEGVAQAWLVRRVLPIDPEVQTYVLALQLRWLLARYGAGGRIVQRLIDAPWPLPHLMVCVIEAELKPLKKTLAAIDGAWHWSRR